MKEKYNFPSISHATENNKYLAGKTTVSNLEWGIPFSYEKSLPDLYTFDGGKGWPDLPLIQ